MKSDQPITDAVRRAIENAELSRYEIAKRANVEQSALSLFVSGQRGLSLVTVDRLAPVLGLSLTIKSPKRKGSK